MSSFDFAQDLFNERFIEVQNYLTFAEVLKDEHKDKVNLTREYEHILKSNICLMQYNLLESSFLELYKGLYAFLKDSDISLDNMNSKFVCYTYGLIRRSPNKKFESLKSILLNESNTWTFSKSAVFTCFELDEEEKKFLINGNLDGRKIKEFIGNWGIDTSALSSLDLTNLKTLKDNRQLLAHGGASFSDIGKEVSWDTLKMTNISIQELFTQTKSLLIDFVTDISSTNSQVA